MGHVLQTTDLDLAEAVLSAAYTSLQVSSSGRRRGLRLEQREPGPGRLDRTVFGVSLVFEAQPAPGFFVARMRGGRLENRRPDGEQRLRPGDVFVAAQPGAPVSATVEDLDVETFAMDAELLASVAQAGPGDDAPIRFLSHEPCSPQDALRWRRSFDLVERETRTGQLSPLAQALAARYLARTALAVLPSTAVLAPTVEDRHDAHPRTLRRALAHIEAHPQHDLTVAEIAAAADVSVRAVQLAFRRHLDTTPLAYLRRVRLAHAYDELATRDRTQTTVTDVAARWGFFNAGRFSAAYRHEYGQLPHDTLQR